MLGWIFDTLSRRTAIWLSEWCESSITRNKISYPIQQKVIRNAVENNSIFLLITWTSICLITVTVGWFIPEFFKISLLFPTWDISTQLTYFGTLWTIQATLVALVYPIVIAFVAVLLQRRATAKLSLRIYALDAAIAPAGSSAIALLSWMGLQYLFIAYIPIDWLFAAMVGNSIWFILNALLTGWFLYRTVQFLDDDARLEVFKRFAIQISFVREVQDHISGLIFTNAQVHKIIPGDQYGEDNNKPQVLLFPMAIGDPCITIPLSKERVIKDVRLRLLRWGVKIWLRSAAKVASDSSVGNLKSTAPMLEIPIAVGDIVKNEVVICRIKNGPTPGWLSKFLIKKSIVFGQPLSKNLSYSTYEILEELSMEVLEFAERNRYEAAGEALTAVLQLHIELIKSGAYINDMSVADNSVLLPDPYGFGSQKIHQRWLRVYRALGEVAVQKILVDSAMWRRHCNISFRLISSLQDEHISILTYTLNVSTNLMYRLGLWWTERIEERGIANHNALNGKVLPPPFSSTYERALTDFIGSWESIRIYDSDKKITSPAESWNKQSRQAIFVTKKAEETAHMLLAAVQRGDKAAALWLTDSLLKGWDEINIRFDHRLSSGNRNDLITLSCACRSWDDVRSLLDVIPEESQEVGLTVDIANTMIKRFWADLRITIIGILIHWTPSQATSNAFTFELIAALIQGKNLKHGGQVVVDSLENPSELVFRLLRLLLVDREYSAILDRVIERAQDLYTPDMVSGRIYSSSGAHDIMSIGTALTQMLAAITATAFASYQPLTGLVQKWSKNLAQLQQMHQVAQRLKSCIDDTAFEAKADVTLTIRRAIGRNDDVTGAKGFIEGYFDSLIALALQTQDNTLTNAAVSQLKLDELGKDVSEHLLDTDNSVFPFSLKPKIVGDSYIKNSHHFSFSGLDKSEYVDPPLEKSSLFTKDTICEYVSKSVGSWIVLDYIASTSITPIRNSSEDDFFKDLVIKADSIIQQGLNPILLVAEQGAPEWLTIWRVVRNSKSSSHNSQFRLRKEVDESSLIAYFENIPGHRIAYADSNCYVVPREHFEVIRFETQPAGPCVSVTFTPEPNNKINIQIFWKFGTRAV